MLTVVTDFFEMGKTQKVSTGHQLVKKLKYQLYLPVLIKREPSRNSCRLYMMLSPKFVVTFCDGNELKCVECPHFHMVNVLAYVPTTSASRAFNSD
jgi:hypothetical protein